MATAKDRLMAARASRCIIPGCPDARGHASGLCRKHYRMGLRHGWIGPNPNREELAQLVRRVNAQLPTGPCRVPGCRSRGHHDICSTHRMRACGRGLDYSALSPEQLAGLATLLHPPVPKLPCRVPGCRGRGPANLCSTHKGRAINRGLDYQALSPEQLAGLAKLLHPPIPKEPCRVPGCIRVGPSGLCNFHAARARRRCLDVKALTAKELADLAVLHAPARGRAPGPAIPHRSRDGAR